MYIQVYKKPHKRRENKFVKEISPKIFIITTVEPSIKDSLLRTQYKNLYIKDKI